MKERSFYQIPSLKSLPRFGGGKGGFPGKAQDTGHRAQKNVLNNPLPGGARGGFPGKAQDTGHRAQKNVLNNPLPGGARGGFINVKDIS